jgi:hypothetical protein
MPRPRLHTSSIVVGLIVALLLVLIEIPGRVVTGVGGRFASKVFEHGWPWVCLRRESGERPTAEFYASPEGRQLTLSYSPVFYPLNVRSDLPHWGIPWLNAENWRFRESDTTAIPPRWALNRENLFWNVAIALLLLAGVIGAWELWRRRQASPLSFRFGLRGLLVCVAAAGGLLGWLTHLERDYGRETALIDRVDERSGPMEATWYDNDHVCVAPLWLRSLVGVRVFPEYFWRASAVELKPERGDKTDLMCAEIAQLDYVTKVSIDGHPRHHFRFSALRNFEQLETLEIWTHPIIEEQDINELAQLKQLEKIVIERINEIAPDLLAQLGAALPDCKIIDYLDDWSGTR